MNFWKGTWFTVIDPSELSTGLTLLSDFMNSFHIFAFALASGYLFYYLKIEQGKYEKFQSFLIGKTKRLIVPYVFVCIIWVIPIVSFALHFTRKSNDGLRIQ